MNTIIEAAKKHTKSALGIAVGIGLALTPVFEFLNQVLDML